MEASSWQTKLSTVRERNLYAFNKSLFCDVEFSVLDANGGRVTLQAHRYILAISSPVFEAMFYGELAETGPTIDLPDCTKEGLQEMLHYVYSDEVSLTGSNVMQVLYLAKKYMFPFLEQKCREYLKEELKPEDVFIVLPQVMELGDDELEKPCWNVIERETERAVASEPFLDVSHEVLFQVLGRERLKIQEVDLFQAVDKWVSKRIKDNGIEGDSGENKRAILGEEAIHLIRFPLMSQKDFAEIVVPKVILNLDEVSEMIQIFSSLPPSKRIFSSKKRAVIRSKARFANFEKPYKAWQYSNKNKKQDAIDFTVNKAVSLVGVRLFGSQGNSYDVHLSVSQNDKVLSQVFSLFATEDVMTEDQYYGFTVFLKEPIPLVPGVRYTIAATIQGTLSYYGQEGQEAVQFGDLEIKYSKSSKSTNGTNVEGGQFVTIFLQ